MTHKREQSKKLKEFNSLFLSLDEQAQDQTLIMLRTLEFAQSVSSPRQNSGTVMERRQSDVRCTAV